MKAALIGLIASVAIASSASATSFTVNANDSIYGSYSGTVSAPGSFSWQTAGYHWGGNIGLTSGGAVIANVVTNLDDVYTLYTADATIGLPCAASACLAVTNGQTISLYNTISALNGGSGVCCDFNRITPEITVSGVPSAVPEVSTWIMMVLGFGGLGALLRRRRGVVSAA